MKTIEAPTDWKEKYKGMESQLEQTQKFLDDFNSPPTKPQPLPWRWVAFAITAAGAMGFAAGSLL